MSIDSSGDITGLPAAPVALGGMGLRTARNTILVLIARVISRGIALVTVIATGNYLTDYGFGQMQTVITYVGVTSILMDLGYNVLYLREGARDPKQLSDYLNSIIPTKALLALAAFVVLISALHIPQLENLAIPAFGVMLLGGYSNLLRSTLYAVQKLYFEIVAIVLESVFLLLLVLLGIRTHQGVAFFLWSYAIVYAINCVYFLTILIARKLYRPQLKIDFVLLREWFVPGLSLGFISVITTIYFKLDVPILQHFRSYDEVGWYTLAYKPFEALTFIPLSLRSVAFPVMAIYHGSSPARLQILTQKLYRMLLAFGWPCTVGLFVLAPQINRFLHLFPNSEPALRILAIGIVFLFVDNAFISTLMATDRQNLYAKIVLFGLAFNLIANVLIIPHFGYLGAAWTTVITEAALVSLGWWSVRRAGISVPIFSSGWRIIVAGTLMGLALFPFHNLRALYVPLVIAGGVMVYGLACLLLGVADEDERDMVSRMLPRKRVKT